MERAAVEGTIDPDVVVGPATVRRLQCELSRRGIERLGVRAVGAGCGRVGDGVNLLRSVNVEVDAGERQLQGATGYGAQRHGYLFTGQDQRRGRPRRRVATSAGRNQLV